MYSVGCLDQGTTAVRSCTVGYYQINCNEWTMKSKPPAEHNNNSPEEEKEGNKKGKATKKRSLEEDVGNQQGLAWNSAME